MYFLLVLAQGVSVPVSFGSNEVMALLVIGFLMSPVTSFLIRLIPPGEWHSTAKAILTFVVCLVAALVLVLVRGQWTPADLLTTFLILFATAIFFYNMYFKPSGIAHAISGT